MTIISFNGGTKSDTCAYASLFSEVATFHIIKLQPLAGSLARRYRPKKTTSIITTKNQNKKPH